MLHTPLYDYQKEGVRQLRDFGLRAILGDDLGLGKTLQSLYAAWRYVPTDPPGPVVILCPAHLKQHWKREAQHHLGLRAELLSGETAPRDKRPPPDPNQIYVVNYEVLVPPLWPRSAPLPADSWAAYLVRLRPRVVIADEGQRLKNHLAACTRAAKRLFRAAPAALALTGTPLANSPADVWTLLNLVRPDLYPSRHDFLEEFTHAFKAFGRWHYKGARNLDVLHAALRRHALVRRLKADVLDQLPPLRVSVEPVDVDLTEYRRAEDDYLGWLEAARPGASAAARHAESLARMGGLKRLAGELKVPAVAAWAQSLRAESGGKVLVGALHYGVTGPLVKALGRGTLLVDGRVASDAKQTAFDQFNADPRVHTMVGNLDAVGTGWSCRATSDALVAELPWRPDQLTQFMGRLHGVGRGLPGSPAHVRVLVAEGTIEEDLCQVLEKKATWARAAIDGVGDAGELDIYAQTRALLVARRRGPSRGNS